MIFYDISHILFYIYKDSKISKWGLNQDNLKKLIKMIYWGLIIL